MEITGTIKRISDLKQVSDTFKKQEFVLITDENTPYPQNVEFQIAQDKCSMLAPLEEGMQVRVQFNIRGKEWNGPQGLKYFNTLDAWRVEKI